MNSIKAAYIAPPSIRTRDAVKDSEGEERSKLEKGETCESIGMAAPFRTPPHGASTLENLKEIASKANDNARKFGVDIKKRKFMGKALALAASVVGLSAAIAVTALTGGGAPLLAIASVSFCIVLADTCCALYDWHSKKMGGSGLPMEDDGIGNAVLNIARRFNVSDEASMKVGTFASTGGRALLAVGGAVAGQLDPASLAGSAKVAVTIMSSAVAPFLSKIGKSVEGGETLKNKQEDNIKMALNINNEIKFMEFANRLNFEFREWCDKIEIINERGEDSSSNKVSFFGETFV
ncbi:hypothetical protein [Burkholderia cepacia]|uniref:hypothetical protein n=1 Tax=Burkholderia cepacia TaxID=292 RepID=UPI000B091DE1|nr:hypothetical protein [Burkholderia cepacia]